MPTPKELPFLDIQAPGFSTRGPEVMAARQRGWCARTPLGFAVLCHKQAGQLLRDRRMRQGSHDWPRIQNLTGSFANFWKRSVISMEGPAHKSMRRVAQSALSSEFIASKIPDFEQVAEILLAKLRKKPDIEFIRDFSEPFAGLAITRLLGLPDHVAPSLAHDASRLGLAMGLGARKHQHIFNPACDRLMTQAQDLVDQARQSPDPTSFATLLVKAFDEQSHQDPQKLLDLIVISIFGGVDTTRAQLGFAMALFTDHPDQWQKLRERPALTNHAIEEVIRHRPTTTWATRQALEDIHLDGQTLPKNALVHILVHATATDPELGQDNRFDITQHRKLHFGFGGGAHHCLGQLVARTDMAAALRVLTQAWRQTHWTGAPDYLPDSGNTSPTALPLRADWAEIPGPTSV